MKSNIKISRKDKTKIFISTIVFFICVNAVLFSCWAMLFLKIYSAELNDLNISKIEVLASNFGFDVVQQKDDMFFEITGSHFNKLGLSGEEMLVVYGTFFVISLFFSMIFLLIISSKKRTKEEKIYYKNEQMLSDQYFRKNNTPVHAAKFFCYSTSSAYCSLQNQNIIVWISNETIYFLNSEFQNSFGRVEISLSEILCFSRYGDFYTSTNVSGGGINLGGAVLGYALGGVAGSIIAGREKIKTETRVHDQRQTLVLIEKDNKEEFIFFEPNAYNYLIHSIPKKEYRFVLNNIGAKENKSIETGNVEKDKIDKLKDLQDLKMNGTIDEKEFAALKKEILFES